MKKTYRMPILSSAEINWEAVDRAVLDEYVWGGDYRPETYAQAVYVKTGDEKEGLYAHLWIREQNPRATHTVPDSMVCEDSCLEFFFTMSDATHPELGFVNYECNALGTAHVGFGPYREGRTFVEELTGVRLMATPKVNADSWELFEFIPKCVLTALFGIEDVTENTRMRANFTRCGDFCVPSTYGTWSPIGTPQPDYHTPAFFGDVILGR